MTAATDERLDTEAPARWTRLASLGFLMVAAGALLMLVATTLWGLDISEDLVFFVAPIVLGVLAAWLVRRRHVAAKIGAAVLGFLMLGVLWWTVLGIATPASFFDFVPGLLVLPGALLGMVGSIAAIFAQRRGHVTERPAGGERRALTIIPVALLALGALSAVLTLTGRETVDESAADSVIRLSDFEFEEDLYQLQAGSTVLVRNDDPFFHTFTIDALGIDEAMNPGSETLVTIPEEAGSFVLYCEPHTSDKEEPADDDMATRVEVS